MSPRSVKILHKPRSLNNSEVGSISVHFKIKPQVWEWGQRQSDRFGTEELFIKHYENKILNNVPLRRFFTCWHVRTRSLNKYRNDMYRYTLTALCRSWLSFCFLAVFSQISSVFLGSTCHRKYDWNWSL